MGTTGSGGSAVGDPGRSAASDGNRCSLLTVVHILNYLSARHFAANGQDDSSDSAPIDPLPGLATTPNPVPKQPPETRENPGKAH
jgi:hypothetical protein